jgi:hypothetical protein
LSADHVIDVFNSEGVPIRRIPNTAYDLAMDKNGQLYCVDIEDEVIRIIDETSGFLGIVYVSINMSRDLSGIEIMDNGTIVCEDQRFDSDSRAVAFYRKR